MERARPCAAGGAGDDVIGRRDERGEIGGGRFVGCFVGEQFALPQAVELLRSMGPGEKNDRPVIVAASDPLNLAGILSGEARVSPYSHLALAYRSGTVIEVGMLGELLSKLQHLQAPQRG